MSINPYPEVTPVFKYVGGKSWLKAPLRQAVISSLKSNSNINRYVEMFSGGLGSFLAVYDILHAHGIKSVVLNDINPAIINFYKLIFENNFSVILSEFKVIEDKFSSSIPISAEKLNATKHKEILKELLVPANDIFKEARTRFNTIKHEYSPVTAAHLLFLQFHSFNGIYRENSKGEYNTPFNWTPLKVSTDLINVRLEAMFNVLSLFEIFFSSLSFENLELTSSDLIYADPPYLNDLSSENKYSKSGFTLSQQINLIHNISSYSSIYSNHAHPNLLPLLLDSGASLSFHDRKNTISANTVTRSNSKIEVLALFS